MSAAEKTAPRRCLPPNPPVPRTARRLPGGTCDSHAHVFGDPACYPLDPARGYTPSTMTIDDYRAAMEAYGIDRAVLVQPSVYGFDNSALFDALAQMPDRLRGIAVLAPGTSDEDIRRAHDLGVRGVRINPRNPAGLTLADTRAIADRIAPFGWHIQMQIGIDDHADLAGLVAGLGVPVVIDHFGFPDLRAGSSGRGFCALVALAAEGGCWVKLSAASRLVGPPERFALLAPLVERLVAEAPRQLLWGLDWPHTECFETVPDDDALIDLVFDWFETPALRDLVLRDNPARLYFGEDADAASAKRGDRP